MLNPTLDTIFPTFMKLRKRKKLSPIDLKLLWRRYLCPFLNYYNNLFNLIKIKTILLLKIISSKAKELTLCNIQSLSTMDFYLES